MGEPLILTHQIGQSSTSSDFYYEAKQAPLSPTAERYKIKYAFLQEKWDYIEAQTSVLRRRVQETRREVEKALEMRRALCNILDERGDHWYKSGLYMDDNVNSSEFDYSSLTELSMLRGEPFDLTPRKKSRPSGKSRSKAAKAKEIQSPEKKEEEERTHAKIVSIIDSVKSETARKTAKIEEEMKSKVASVAMNVVSAGSQSFTPSRHQSGGPTSKVPSSAATHSKGSQVRQVQPKGATQTIKKGKPLPYKILVTQLQSQANKPPVQQIDGMIEGIKFSYTPFSNLPDGVLPSGQTQLDDSAPV